MVEHQPQQLRPALPICLERRSPRVLADDALCQGLPRCSEHRRCVVNRLRQSRRSSVAVERLLIGGRAAKIVPQELREVHPNKIAVGKVSGAEPLPDAFDAWVDFESAILRQTSDLDQLHRTIHRSRPEGLAIDAKA